MHPEDIMPFVVQYIDRCGTNMLFIESDVFDVEITALNTEHIAFSARDIYGDTVAAVKVALHLFKSLTTGEKIVSFLEEQVHDALADSARRNGRTVMLLR